MPSPDPAGPPLHVARVPVRWGDMDALGHVNNVTFVRYAEQARVEVLDALGPDWTAAADGGPLVVALQAEYRRPVVYPATLLVAVHVGHVGTTSFRLDGVMTVEGEDGEPVCRVDATVVWVSRATGRPAPLPDAVRAALAVPDDAAS